MTVSPINILRQKKVIASMIKVACNPIVSKFLNNIKSHYPVLEEKVECRNPELIKDYIYHTGGELSWYKNIVPPHMFPQWGFPILTRTLEKLPYNLSKILNAGARIEITKHLPADVPLILKAQLIELDDNGQRVIFKQKLITGTDLEPECLISYVTAILQLKKTNNNTNKKTKEKPVVDLNAREIDKWHLSEKYALSYAMLTGDFNPVHWSKIYASIAGYSNVFLHGFASMARCIESLNKSLFSGNIHRLKSFDIRFISPVILPCKAGVYINNNYNIFLGSSPGAKSYIIGNFSTK